MVGMHQDKHGVASRRKHFSQKSILSPAAIPIILSIVCFTIIHQSKNNLVSDAFLLPLSRGGPKGKKASKVTSTKSSFLSDHDNTCVSSFSKNIQILPQLTNRCYRHIPLCMTDSPESAIEISTDSSAASDTPLPTENGGYTHTTASRAKISAANKGKTPWNKGKQRSEEVKQRIAEGVRRKNREKFLNKLEELGLTEEEYEQQKKEERRAKDAERKSRRTEKGGYRPTEETKQKISKILKEKHAKGEIKKRKYNGPFRKGFTHTKETKEKIGETLRKKWAEDPEYAATMRLSSSKDNSPSARQKISQTLRDKWKDPEFRERMMKAMRGRKSKSSAASKAQREKISVAMKKKWQDANYRKKAIDGMEKYRDNLPPKPQKAKITRTSPTAVDRIVALTPMTKRAKKTKTSKVKVKVSSATAGVSKAKKKKAAKKKKIAKKKSKVTLAVTAKKKDGPAVVKEKKKELKKDDGDISRMREERRDLYDLLYGDEGDSSCDEEESVIESPAAGVLDLDLLAKEEVDDPKKGEPEGLSSFYTSTSDLDDDDLDDFDPYNLDDY